MAEMVEMACMAERLAGGDGSHSDTDAVEAESEGCDEKFSSISDSDSEAAGGADVPAQRSVGSSQRGV